MNKISSFLLTFLFMVFSNQVLADRENDMWQQFKAQKAMNELDAEFNKRKPEPEVVEHVRIVERPVPQPQLQPQPVAVTPVPVPVSAPMSEPAMVTVESQGFVFKLGACRLAHQNIKCQLTIASVETDGHLTLYGTYGSVSSKLFDHNGNEYMPSTIAMGNKNNSAQVNNKYISGVEARGNVEFTNVGSSTNSIAMFELSFHNHVIRKRKSVQFRNVPLSL